MKQVCPLGPTVNGIDIYHGDYIEDITQVVAAGVKYVFLKAWERAIDSSFRSRWAAMKKAGLIRGAYDFFHPGLDPIVQANGFLDTFDGVLEDGDLPCALDFEVTDGAARATILNNALKWLNYVEQRTGKTPILYMSPGFTALDSRFSKYPLWIANYGVVCPHVPDAHQNWTFWQGSESGKVPGMRGACDTDVFNGTMSDLYAFIAKSKI
jgi:lysozyme